MRNRLDSLVVDPFADRGPLRRTLDRLLWLSVWVALGVGCFEGTLWGQTVDDTSDALRLSTLPDVIAMKNGAGETVIVSREQYEAYEQYLQSIQPKSSIGGVESLDRLELDIQANRDIARVTVDAHVAMDEPSRTWHSIPLGLGQIQFVPTEHGTDGQTPGLPIRVGTQTNGTTGYLWRFGPSADPEHHLHANALTKVLTDARGSSLRLDLPNTPTIVRLRLPEGDWELTIDNLAGSDKDIAEPFVIAEGESRATIHSVGGTLILKWNKKIAMEAIQSIEGESETKYIPTNELHLFRVTTQIKIRGPSRLAGRRFQIVLPKGSQWREPVDMSKPSLYRIALQEDPNESPPIPGGGPGGGIAPNIDHETFLSLVIDKGASNEVDVTLIWQLAVERGSEQARFVLPKIEGLQRHRGFVECVVPRNIAMTWEPESGVSLAKQSTSNDGGDSIVYRFRFDDPMAGVTTTWKSFARTPSIRAQATVSVGEDRVTMLGSIDINSDPLQIPRLQLEVIDWSIDQCTLRPSGRQLPLSAIRAKRMMNADGVEETVLEFPISETDLLDAGAGSPDRPRNPNGSTLSVDEPLRNDPSTPLGTPMASPQTRLEFQLSRPSSVQAHATGLALALPRITWFHLESQQRMGMTPGGELQLQSSTLKLQPRSGDSGGTDLTPVSDVGGAATRTKPHRSTHLKYRVRQSEAWVRWLGKGVPLGSATVASATALFTLGTDNAILDQSWRCISSGQVPKSILLDIPSDWEETEGSESTPVALECRIDGNIVVPEWLPRNNGSASPTRRPIAMRVPLSEVVSDSSGITEFTLTVRHAMTTPKIEEQAQEIPFGLAIARADGPIDSWITESFEGRGMVETGMECTIANASTLPAIAHRSGGLAFHWNDQENQIVVNVARRQSLSTWNVQVERQWMQTILNAVERRDRFVARIRTRESRVVLEMPFEGMTNNGFLVDGRRANAFQDPTRPRFVSLEVKPTSTSSDEWVRHTIEVFSSPKLRSGWVRELSTMAPRIEDADGYAPIIWQVVVPRTEHMIRSSNQLAPSYRWQWNDLWFIRKSEWTQGELERWLGATNLPSVGAQTNQYAFFAIDSRQPMKIWLAPQYLLWLPVAIIVLIGASAAVEFRWLRKHPLNLLLVLFACLWISQLSLDLGVLLMQSFVSTSGLAIMYYAIRWTLNRRARLRSVFSTRSMSGGSHFQRPVSSSGVSGGEHAASTAASPSNIVPVSEPGA